jgi:serine/threonine protein kinase
VLQPGQQVGDYRIERVLAEGGMGAVYVATQLSTGRQRALKAMHARFASQAGYVERFVAEARVASQIQSEHVVEVVGAGIDGPTQTPWLAMELLEGQSLDQLIAARGPLPAEEVLQLFEQFGHGLAAAHAAGIIHRDLKPENVFIARSKRVGLPFVVKILDFGIAKWTQEAKTASGSQAIGTPFWMSPEQAQLSGRIGPRTDLWALGLLAFYALTGRNYWFCAQPGSGGTVPHFLHEVLMQVPEPASVRASRLGVPVAIPPAFDAFFSRCLAREPLERYATVEACMDSLRAVLSAPRNAPTTALGTMVMVAGTLPMPPSSSAPGFGSGPTTPVSFPGHVPVVAEPARSHVGLYAALAIAALVLVLGMGSFGVMLLLDEGDDADRTTRVASRSTTSSDAALARPVDEFQSALDACEAGLRAEDAEAAGREAQRAIALRPGDASALSCRDRAAALRAERGTFDRGVAALARGAHGEAHSAFAELPPASAFRNRPEVPRAAQGLAGERLSEGRRVLSGEPADAFLLARSVARLTGITPAQESDAAALEAQALARGGTLYEGRVVSGSGVTAESCAISVLDTRTRGFNCRFRIRCDRRLIYGASSGGFNRCQRADGRFTHAADQGTTRRDGDPEMTFDLPNRRARVSDPALGLDVVMQIAEPLAGDLRRVRF